MRYQVIAEDGQSATLEVKTSMRAIAAHAGVSLKTVSRVVNNEPGVSAETAERVRQSIDQLRYQHGRREAPPRSGNMVIGLILERAAEPFQSIVGDAVERAAWARGYLTVAASTQADPDREAAIIHEMQQRDVAGIILVPSPAGRYQQSLLSRQQDRVVLIDRAVPNTALDVVHADNVGGAHEAVRHLIERGHRRIAIMGSDTSFITARERLRGYRQTLLDAGIGVDQSLVRMRNLSASTVEQGLQELAALQEPPTAIFTANGSYTIEVLRHFHRNGTELALVGFDDFPLSDIALGGITVVSQHPEAIGQAAADLLFQRIDGDAAAPRKILIGTDLIIRRSSALPVMPLRYP